MPSEVYRNIACLPAPGRPVLPTSLTSPAQFCISHGSATMVAVHLPLVLPDFVGQCTNNKKSSMQGWASSSRHSNKRWGWGCSFWLSCNDPDFWRLVFNLIFKLSIWTTKTQPSSCFHCFPLTALSFKLQVGVRAQSNDRLQYNFSQVCSSPPAQASWSCPSCNKR